MGGRGCLPVLTSENRTPVSMTLAERRQSRRKEGAFPFATYEGEVPLRTVLIVDDHDGVRKALRDWLELEYSELSISEAWSGEMAVQRSHRLQPDIVLMDIRLPGMDGLEATRQAREAAPGAKIIIITVEEASQYREQAQLAGASAYIPKRRIHSELIPALNQLMPADEPVGGLEGI
jgi:CheY-like chemotaxis protein